MMNLNDVFAIGGFFEELVLGKRENQTFTSLKEQSQALVDSWNEMTDTLKDEEVKNILLYCIVEKVPFLKELAIRDIFNYNLTVVDLLKLFSMEELSEEHQEKIIVLIIEKNLPVDTIVWLLERVPFVDSVAAKLLKRHAKHANDTVLKALVRVKSSSQKEAKLLLLKIQGEGKIED